LIVESVNQLFEPASEAEIVDVVQRAAVDRNALTIAGADTKRGWGRPVMAAAQLSVKNFGGIDLYEPEELVLSARAGTTMSEIAQRLSQQGQHLAFEPPDFGPLFGSAAGAGTLGGTVACNLAGPRRIAAGAARDHVLGFAGVNGLGDAFKAGGRVVKNVTGFDLAKLMSGSFGTLAVMTTITLKVLPAPEDSCSVLVFGPTADAAIEIMGLALRSPHEPSGVAFLPERVAARAALATDARSGSSVVVLRLEGASPSVRARCAALKDLLMDRGEIVEIAAAESRDLWHAIRDVAPLIGDGTRAVWHLSVPPAMGARVAAEIAGADDDLYFDWGGGRIWFASATDPFVACDRIRAAINRTGGHATLFRASAQQHNTVAVFQPLSRVEATLVGRLKDQFDPYRILNPGRMYEGL
jgi:glycolate oxidase FAD binding subunit